MKSNIVLIGFMGCGKSTIGKELACALDYAFVDTDAYIEESTSKTISDIFAEHGEEYFRDLETEMIGKLMGDMDRAVISTGGGLPLREVNADILKKNGFVVYLRVKGKTVEHRLKGDTQRPLLQGEHVSEKIKNLLEFRDPIYEYGAHMVLDVDTLTVPEIAEDIMRNFKLLQMGESEKETELEGKKCMESDN